MPAARTLRWGIIGCGRIATTVASAIRTVEGCELHAVASRDAARAAAFAAANGAARHFADYRALAACPEVDVVYVATPPSCHAADSLLCIGQGKHVLCEKPFALDAAEARRMAQAARAQGVLLMEAMWTRFLPAIGQLEELVRAGRIGTPQLLLAGGAFRPAPDPDYYLFRPELGGGVMRDAGVYLVHLAHWLLGKPRTVQARCVIGAHGVDDQDGALLGYDSGALALLHVSMRASQRPGLELLGSEGSLRLLPPLFNPGGIEWIPRTGSAQSWQYASDESGYRHQIAEVARCLGAGLTESPRMPLQLSIEVMESVDRILAGARPES